MENISVIAVDISKHSFQVHAASRSGRAVYRGKLRREKFCSQIASRFSRGSRLVMEACGGANHWGRTLHAQGFDVKLIAPQFVKPFVKSSKNDAADAEAIAEAASRDNMRYVAVKTLEQQDFQSILRVRERNVTERTRLINEIRGLLQEYGVVLPQGPGSVRSALPTLMSSELLTDCMKRLLHDLWEDLQFVDARVRSYDREIKKSSDLQEAFKHTRYRAYYCSGSVQLCWKSKII